MSTAATAPPAGLQRDQLAGFVVALTSDRRSEELISAFTRRGATVLHAPTLRIVPLAEDAELVHATEDVIARPPDDVIVTTGIGFRGWMEGADAAGLAPQLSAVLGGARLLARGPKARGAIRAAGLVEAWAATSETTAEVVDLLLAEGVAGRRIAVQLHGATDPGLLARLLAAGAEVQEVPVYRWGPTPDPASVQRAIEATCLRAVDAVVFTSAPGSQAFLDAAECAGRLDDVVAALREDVVAAAVGSITAGPLTALGLDPLVPDRFRLGALVRSVADHLSGCRVLVRQTIGGRLELRGQAAALDGRPLALSPAPLAMLRALARRPGQVVDRTTLLNSLPGAGDLHAVEVAVARLRAGLGSTGVIETVVKRGYRLAVAHLDSPITSGGHPVVASGGVRSDG
jgi:uroporphyrinogen-III synthase